ncbi:ribonuclease P protein component [Epilithonimonas sp. UC225_85]|uniref:ribonuclease P protein component n=1 Tax=Epilithonimonas sp. UC225_85 TaxID=3350167 RepID=UPI0036D3DFFD
MKINSFPTHEKLKRKSEIDHLFKKGKWLTVENIRVIHIKSSESFSVPSHRVGVSVSKKFFKRAVDRNRIKRLLRECYRLNKSIYIEAFGERSIVMLFWASKDMPDNFSVVEKQFLSLCKKKSE